LWAELLRDFTVDVVGEPVHLVGNSIYWWYGLNINSLHLSSKKVFFTNIHSMHRPWFQHIFFSHQFVLASLDDLIIYKILLLTPGYIVAIVS
jgi:hypothetical protein